MGFNLNKAYAMVQNLKLGPALQSTGTSKPMQIDLIETRECFLFSQMTISDEKKDSCKYDYLLFIEYLNFLCLFALKYVIDGEPIEHRVFLLLEALYRQEDILALEQAALESPDIEI